MREVTVDPAALLDVIGAAEFYERERPGLGKIFRKFVKDAFLKISKQPQLYAYIMKPYRGYHMEKFPYTVYFRETENKLHILAVFHQRRHPDFWKDRLKDLLEN